MALEREPAKPSHRGTLVAIGITVSQHQADAQRVVKGELWKLSRVRGLRPKPVAPSGQIQSRGRCAYSLAMTDLFTERCGDLLTGSSRAPPRRASSGS